jgi:hypothetical protein
MLKENKNNLNWGSRYQTATAVLPLVFRNLHGFQGVSHDFFKDDARQDKLKPYRMQPVQLATKPPEMWMRFSHYPTTNHDR